MSDYEQKDMDGVCFPVPADQLTEDWMAPWSGKGMIDGQMYWINMYDNTSKAGKSYRKFKFKPMEATTSYNKKPESATKPKAFKGDDDIPW